MHESLKNEKALRKIEAIGILPNHYRDGIDYSVSNLYKIARVSHRVSLWLNYKG
ncbi:hypothetical protein HPHPA16_0897 [Helicobacter pylori Hp A-16]|uniref:Uncharacterized protein n=1 Tax=Helicobacter pylori Hp P-2 TaxID=992073 RepID=J0PNB1_HELPX|nr:hypothetical protein HPHPA6_0770 [Helicobacter pylori Hp A-6]EJB75206.1 hypothetical protein HPHPA16_0897 [Helicobacter pylori Hp A-16]EJC00091.1 hypothetical protein HPHPP2_0802 [Helicobacter pylori Hp P-2]EJC58022.1 hypothetical protein HPHPP2B_0806 [Helicobacter pylori Hp P-2b]